MDSILPEKENSNKDEISVPREWFISNDGKLLPPSAKVNVSVTRSLTFFSIINTKKRLFMCFNVTLKTLIAKQYYPELSIVTVARNQQTKKYPMLQVSTKDRGSKATVFFDKDKTKVIYFKDDHNQA